MPSTRCRTTLNGYHTWSVVVVDLWSTDHRVKPWIISGCRSSEHGREMAVPTAESLGHLIPLLNLSSCSVFVIHAKIVLMLYVYQLLLYLKSLKTKTSFGYDETSTMILKISWPFISPINYICNKMLFGGVFPDRLKYATIKPLHKNEDRCEKSNYRPVSLLNFFQKYLKR